MSCVTCVVGVLDLDQLDTLLRSRPARRRISSRSTAVESSMLLPGFAGSIPYNSPKSGARPTSLARAAGAGSGVAWPCTEPVGGETPAQVTNL